MPPNHLSNLNVNNAVKEDLSEFGDLTSRFFVPEDAKGRGRIFAKEEPAVLSGIEIAVEVFAQIDSDLRCEIVEKDGTQLSNGQTVLTIDGSLRSILTGERTALNFIQQLSGVATLTHQFVEKVRGTKARILDTRKTTPGWRDLEKAAVRHGGGTNHRIGLYDAVMVKDNHLLAKSDPEWIQAGIHAYHEEFPGQKMELEVDNLEQLRQYLTLKGVDVVLLDNMSTDQLREAIAIRDDLAPNVELEASGGVNLDTVAAIAETGVDFISVGALTHSSRAIDFSLELVLVE